MSRAAALEHYLQRFAGVPFDWGSSNCCHFSFGWLDVAEPGNDADLSIPDSKHGALKAVLEHGSLQNLVTARLKRAPISPMMSKVGDLVLLSGDSETALGICNGRTAAHHADPAGVAFTSMENAVCAWPLSGEK